MTLPSARRAVATLPAGVFYGQAERRVAMAGALLSVVRHRCGRALVEHAHERPYFSLLVDGDYEEKSGGRSIVYDTFTIVYHPEGAQHSDVVGRRGGRFFLMELDGRWKDALAMCKRPHVFELDGGAPVWPALRLFQDVATGGALDELTVESLLFEICARVGASAPRKGEEPIWIARAAERIRETFTHPIDLRGLAEDSGVHPVHFAKTYRAFRGRSVGEDVQGQRIQQACRLLRSGDAVGKVAFECGFTDQSYFTRVFHRVTGSTPAAFRRRMQMTR